MRELVQSVNILLALSPIKKSYTLSPTLENISFTPSSKKQVKE
jgi:hypothetical protein